MRRKAGWEKEKSSITLDWISRGFSKRGVWNLILRKTNDDTLLVIQSWRCANYIHYITIPLSLTTAFSIEWLPTSLIWGSILQTFDINQIIKASSLSKYYQNHKKFIFWLWYLTSPNKEVILKESCLSRWKWTANKTVKQNTLIYLNFFEAGSK